MQFGVWCSIASTMAFAAFYAYRVSMEATQLADALAATELVLQREKHLSQLDGLAAAAAHELGTPLATISVVAKEMERELSNDDRFREDVQLLRSQSERCRDILRRLTTLSAEGEEHMRRLPLSSLVEEVDARRTGNSVSRLELIEKNDRAKRAGRQPQCRHYLWARQPDRERGRLCAGKVTVTVEHNAERVAITIEDDGKVMPRIFFPRIGEPYMTKRRSEDERAGGLGLGLFIAKTLLERSGAAIRFGNRDSGEPGARIRYRMAALGNGRDRKTSTIDVASGPIIMKRQAGAVESRGEEKMETHLEPTKVHGRPRARARPDRC